MCATLILPSISLLDALQMLMHQMLKIERTEKNIISAKPALVSFVFLGHSGLWGVDYEHVLFYLQNTFTFSIYTSFEVKNNMMP